VAAFAQALFRQDARRSDPVPAADPAAGRHGLHPVDRIRPPRRDRALARRRGLVHRVPLDRRLEEAAETLGARAWRRFATITLPLSLRGIAAGCVLAFARAFGEFGATISFVSNIPGETRTLPIAIYELLSVPGGMQGVQRLSIVALFVAIAAAATATLIAGGMLRRGNGHDR